jgi:hypothetical protein
MANTIIQVKRTSTAGRTPNTTNSANSQYIPAGGLALNMTDQILYSSDGTNLISIGANQPSLTTSNLQVNNGISVGNSTSNLTVNSTTVFAGNTTVNTTVNTTIVTVANSTANISISPLRLFSGNSTANLSVDMTGIGTTLSIASANLNAGIATIQTTTNHNLTLTPGLSVNVTGSSVAVFNSSEYTKSFSVLSIPSVNTITFSITSSASSQTPSAYFSNGRKIFFLSRSNGVATAVTYGAHGFSNGNSIYITDTIQLGGKNPTYSYSVPSSSPATITTVNSTAFSYSNQPVNYSLLLSSATYSTSSLAITAAGGIYLTITFPTAHSFSAGDRVVLSPGGPWNAFFIGGNSYSFNGTFTISSVTTYSISVLLFNKSKGVYVNTLSGNFSGSGGTALRTFDDIGGSLTTSTYINQIVPNTSIGGTLNVLAPVGVSVYDNNGYMIKIAPTFIYVGPQSSLTGTYITTNKIQTGTG